jgi:hypothetical protein
MRADKRPKERSFVSGGGGRNKRPDLKKIGKKSKFKTLNKN